MNAPVPQMPSPPVNRPRAGWWGGVAVVLLLGSIILEFRVALVTVPRFERLFEDMVGAREKLPLLAQGVLAASRFQAANMVPIAVAVLALAGVLWWKRHTKLGAGCAVVLMLAVVAWSMVAFVGVTLPAAQLVQALGAPQSGAAGELRNHLDVPPKR